jgi:hypothetical protein
MAELGNKRQQQNDDGRKSRRHAPPTLEGKTRVQ